MRQLNENFVGELERAEDLIAKVKAVYVSGRMPRDNTRVKYTVLEFISLLTKLDLEPMNDKQVAAKLYDEAYSLGNRKEKRTRRRK